jgi:hypothetical protein
MGGISAWDAMARSAKKPSAATGTSDFPSRTAPRSETMFFTFSAGLSRSGLGWRASKFSDQPPPWATPATAAAAAAAPITTASGPSEVSTIWRSAMATFSAGIRSHSAGAPSARKPRYARAQPTVHRSARPPMAKTPASMAAPAVKSRLWARSPCSAAFCRCRGVAFSVRSSAMA